MNIKTRCLILIALAIIVCGCTNPKGHLVTEQYTVQSGDTLWAISEVYMAKNTYGKRDIREFYHGIIENNYDAVFVDRVPGLIRPGDKLEINFWVRGE
jgi:nucleoid-associated protein YgaU